MVGLLGKKTTWVGLAAIFTTIGLIVSGETSWVEAITPLAIGLGLITGRHAIQKGR